MSNLVMASIGAQYPSKAAFTSSAVEKIKTFITTSSSPSLPSFWETTSVTDKRGFYNISFIAYWPSRTNFDSWKADSGFEAWWQNSDREADGHGWFLEVFMPPMDRFETVFSNSEVPEGAANMREAISGEIAEHGYWGSMRDRLPAAQDDLLEGTPPRDSARRDGSSTSALSDTESKRIKVPGKKNLCVIRSGQNWSTTLPTERHLYLTTMHPVLTQGMNFLRDQGKPIGCHANNLWDIIDSSTYEASLEKTFGLGFFDDLKSLERWSKSHQTHIDIFGGFLRYARKLGNVISLQLYHEVFVLGEGEQWFEYVGCHGETGMLNA
jgi:hypothetical protein